MLSFVLQHLLSLSQKHVSSFVLWSAKMRMYFSNLACPCEGTLHASLQEVYFILKLQACISFELLGCCAATRKVPQSACISLPAQMWNRRQSTESDEML
jgi:hypothetical protein